MEAYHFDNVPLFEFERGRKQAKVLDIYDGDTFTAVFLHHGSPVKVKVRLAHIDTPEMKGGSRDSKERALSAKWHLVELVMGREMSPSLSKKELRDLLSTNTRSQEIDFLGFDKYGRSLCDLYVEGISASDVMIAAGHGYRYEGGTKAESTA